MYIEYMRQIIYLYVHNVVIHNPERRRSLGNREGIDRVT
jgi:hypothetical protein